MFAQRDVPPGVNLVEAIAKLRPPHSRQWNRLLPGHCGWFHCDVLHDRGSILDNLYQLLQASRRRVLQCEVAPDLPYDLGIIIGTGHYISNPRLGSVAAENQLAR